MRIDLHTHSTRSDGTESPAVLMAQAADAGLDVVAITDHDTTAGWAEAAAAAEIGLVRGIEMSTRLDGRGVHLLAYLPDPGNAALVAELAEIVRSRGARLPSMVAGLRSSGIEITEADVRRHSGPDGVIGRPHVADALVALGVVAGRDEAFATLLAPGGPGYQRRHATDTRTAIHLVRDAGGVPVLAHPWGRRMERVLTPSVIAELADAGLAGLEVDHEDHTPEQRAGLRDLAGSLDLIVTGSSDHHGTGKIGHALGCHTTDPAQLERLLAQAGPGAVAFLEGR